MLLKQDSPVESSNKRPRSRKKRQGKRLLDALKSALEQEADVTVLGEDPLFSALLKQPGGKAPISAPCQILFNDTPLTIVGIPDRLWNNSVPRGQLWRTRLRMEELGRRCILLPQSAIAAYEASSCDRPSTLRIAFDHIGAQQLFRCQSPSDPDDTECVAPSVGPH